MQVTQFHPELFSISNVTVVVSLLPEDTALNISPLAAQALGEGKFQEVDGVRQGAPLGFAEQKVDVFGHDHISIDANGKATAHIFQALWEEIVYAGRREVGFPMKTGEGDEVGLL